MTTKYDRDAIAQTNEIKIVQASEDEEPPFWLVEPDGAAFPISLEQLHDVMHALHDLHDQVHHH